MKGAGCKDTEKQRYREKEIMRRRESQGWGAGDRDGEQKSSEGQKYREFKKIFSGSTTGIEQEKKNNQQEEGCVTGPWGSEREGTQSKAEE